jgi:HlyD family secretion protein
VKKKRSWWWVLLGAALLGGGAWYGYQHFFAAQAPAVTGPVIEVTRGELLEAAAASGVIEPHMQVQIKSRSSGLVTEVLVEEGQRVAPNQLMFRLDPIDAERVVKDARAALRRAQSDLAQARASLTVAEAEAGNARTTSELSQRGAELGVVAADSERTAKNAANVALANVELRRAQVAGAEAQLETARLAVDEATRRRAETEIYAPFAGTVLSVEVERGLIVASAVTNVSGGSALATLADLSDLRVVGALDEAQIGRVAVAQKVVIRVDAYPDRTFEGRVERVSPLGVTKQNVVTFDVEIVVTDKDASLLRSGMSADLEIETARLRDVITVPLAAITTQGKERFVRLQSGDLRKVETGATDGVRIVIKSGLREGESIVITPAVSAQGPTSQNKSLFPMGRPKKAGSKGGSPH